MTRLALAAAMVATISVGPQPQTTALACDVVHIDRVEREIICFNQRRPVVATFSTVYKIKNNVVSTKEFWDNLTPGDGLSLKVKRHALFSIAIASTISINR